MYIGFSAKQEATKPDRNRLPKCQQKLSNTAIHPFAGIQNRARRKHHGSTVKISTPMVVDEIRLWHVCVPNLYRVLQYKYTCLQAFSQGTYMYAPQLYKASILHGLGLSGSFSHRSIKVSLLWKSPSENWTEFKSARLPCYIVPKMTYPE